MDQSNQYPLVKDKQRSQSNVSTSVADLKKSVASQVNDLPDNKTGETTLHHIEDLLQSVGVGNRLSIIQDKMKSVDPTDELFHSQKVYNDLSRFLYSIDMTRAEREDLFTKWKEGLININHLLSTKASYPVQNIVYGYRTNRAIRELTDEFIKQTAYGIGKGEYFLTVFSNRISRPGRKGDLLIDNDKHVELKTKDAKPGRFTDRNIAPDSQWQEKCDRFKEAFKVELQNPQLRISATGINLKQLQMLLQSVDARKQGKIRAHLIGIFQSIFKDPSTEVLNQIIDNLINGNYNEASILYAKEAVQNYLDQKQLYGILLLDVSKDITFSFFKDINDFNAQDVIIKPETAYPIALRGANAYPQTHAARTTYTQPQTARPNVQAQVEPTEQPVPNVAQTNTQAQTEPAALTTQANQEPTDLELERLKKLALNTPT